MSTAPEPDMTALLEHVVAPSAGLSIDYRFDQMFVRYEGLSSSAAILASRGISERNRQHYESEFQRQQAELAELLTNDQDALDAAMMSPYLQSQAVRLIAQLSDSELPITNESIRATMALAIQRHGDEIAKLAKTSTTPLFTRSMATRILDRLASRSYSTRGHEGEQARRDLLLVATNIFRDIHNLEDLNRNMAMIQYALAHGEPHDIQQFKSMILKEVRRNSHWELMPHDEFWNGTWQEGQPTGQVLSNLLDNSQLPEAAEHLFDIGKQLLDQEVGLDTALRDELMAVWRDCSFEYNGHTQELSGRVFIDNLSNIIEMERWKKGSVAELYDRFGIRNIGRYDTNLLQKQLEGIHPPYLLGIATLADHNEAILAERRLLRSMDISLQGEVQVVVMEAETPKELASRLRDMKARHGRAVLGHISGHGFPGGVQMCNGRRVARKMAAEAEARGENPAVFRTADYRHAISYVRTADLGGEVGAALADAYHPQATIGMLSCSTGKDIDIRTPGFGEELSRKTGLRVIAPLEDTSIAELTAHATEHHYELSVKYTNSPQTIFEHGERVY